MTDELDELLEETRPYDKGGERETDDAAAHIRRLRREAANRRAALRETENVLAQTNQTITTLQQQLEALQADTAAKEKLVEERGKTLEEVIAGINESNSAVIASLPEDLQAIVPQGIPPVALRKWLDTAVPVLAKKKPALPLDGEAGSRGKDDVTPKISEDELAVARSLGISPEQYLANKRSK